MSDKPGHSADDLIQALHEFRSEASPGVRAEVDRFRKLAIEDQAEMLFWLHQHMVGYLIKGGLIGPRDIRNPVQARKRRH